MMACPVAGEAATAAGISDPNTIAKVAARKASDFDNDQTCGRAGVTRRPLADIAVREKARQSRRHRNELRDQVAALGGDGRPPGSVQRRNKCRSGDTRGVFQLDYKA